MGSGEIQILVWSVRGFWSLTGELQVAKVQSLLQVLQSGHCPELWRFTEPWWALHCAWDFSVPFRWVSPAPEPTSPCLGRRDVAIATPHANTCPWCFVDGLPDRSLMLAQRGAMPSASPSCPLVLICYLPDSSRSRDSKLQAYHKFRCMLAKWCTACPDCPFVVAGDFNLRCSGLDLTRAESRETPQVLAMLAGQGFLLHRQHSPTHVKGTITDWVFTRNCAISSCMVHAPLVHACPFFVCPLVDSDHFALALTIALAAPVLAPPELSPLTVMPRFSPEGWDHALSEHDWSAPAAQAI